MSAWTNLLAASSLTTGTAWDLLTHPKTGGGSILVHDAVGTINDISVSAVVINDLSVSAVVNDISVSAVVNDISVSAVVNDTTTNIGMYNSDTAVTAYTPDVTIVSVSQGI
jgi:hypothetical protein